MHSGIAITPPRRIVVRRSAQYGNAAFAAADVAFGPGDVVLCEHPTLVVLPHGDAPPRLADALRRAADISRAHGLEPSYFDALLSAGWLFPADAGELHRLIDNLYCPVGDVITATRSELEAAAALLRAQILAPFENQVSTMPAAAARAPATTTNTTAAAGRGSVLRGGSAACSESRQALSRAWASVLGPLRAEAQAELVVKFVHAVRVNTHADNKRCFQGVFPVASKFTHSCAPNTYWFLHADGGDGSDGIAQGGGGGGGGPRGARLLHRFSVIHVALTHIKPGEMLTFGYQGTGMNVLGHTLQRRQSLADLNFVCRCSRCDRFDKGMEMSRPISCALCFGRDASVRGFAHLRLQQHGGWLCARCKEVLPCSAVAAGLRKEKEVIDFLMLLFFGAAAAASASSDEYSADDSECIDHAAATPAKPRVARRQARLLATEMGRHCAAAGDGLSVRWTLALEWVPRQLGATHYAMAIAVASLVRCLIVAAMQQVETGNSDLGPFVWRQQQMESGGGGGGGSGEGQGQWIAALFRAVAATHKWFEKELPRSAQHIRFLAMVTELTVLLLVDTQLQKLLIFTKLSTEVESGRGEVDGGGGAEAAESLTRRRSTFDAAPASDTYVASQTQQLELLRSFALTIAVPIVKPFWERGLSEFEPVGISSASMVRDGLRALQRRHEATKDEREGGA